MTNTPTFKTYDAMVQRCTNPKDPSWANYGGRGIRVCRRWSKFENFLADMGERPLGRTLDRRKTDGDYTPTNCRWATHSEQQKNKRNYWVDGPVVKPHGRPTVDRVGRVYGDLTVISRVYVPGRGNLWECQCTCGGSVTITGYNLDSGNSTTCGNRKSHRRKRKR